MDMTLLVSQVLNGIQLGLILFLLAAGLTLIFGILDFINLAHGAFYMLGAFLVATVSMWSGSFLLGLVAAAVIVGIIGIAVEYGLARTLYHRDHLEQVLATFGLLLVVDTAVHYIWGPAGLSVPLPTWLDGFVRFGGITLPAYRIFIVVCGLLLAAALWFVIARTRIGMVVRASASNRAMAEALGIETKLVFAGIFGVGAVVAGIAGSLVAPISGASIGMGGPVIILAFVIIIIGGLGSIRGAFIAAMLVGIIDTLGRAYIGSVLATVFTQKVASTAGPALASILIYLIMCAVLAFKPEGLFPPASR
ncbi:branched-chain amino acid ABC transporter permease [Halodurantibacterium flavum]|uniref:Branched-chain amino acid ABC transporter permease n=2 Tax=Halodurantibacterium flavum TaxID=1382802 RepID=A0ABW4S2P3_9RHOB